MEGVKHFAENYYEVQFYDIDQLNIFLQVRKMITNLYRNIVCILSSNNWFLNMRFS